MRTRSLTEKDIKRINETRVFCINCRYFSDEWYVNCLNEKAWITENTPICKLTIRNPTKINILNYCPHFKSKTIDIKDVI